MSNRQLLPAHCDLNCAELHRLHGYEFFLLQLHQHHQWRHQLLSHPRPLWLQRELSVLCLLHGWRREGSTWRDVTWLESDLTHQWLKFAWLVSASRLTERGIDVTWRDVTIESDLTYQWLCMASECFTADGETWLDMTWLDVTIESDLTHQWLCMTS